MEMKSVVRRGDMHPNRALRVHVQRCGDVVIAIEQDGIPIGDVETGDPEERAAQIEFCVSPLRSRHTVVALRNLIEAVERDNVEWPIAGQ